VYEENEINLTMKHSSYCHSYCSNDQLDRYCVFKTVKGTKLDKYFPASQVKRIYDLLTLWHWFCFFFGNYFISL